MENKQIQDGSFSASSQQIGKDAKFARLNDAKSWCASSASDQWLQVDLGNVYTITAITTQGSGDKDSCEFVTSYTVAYSTSSPSSLSNLEDFPGRAVVRSFARILRAWFFFSSEFIQKSHKSILSSKMFFGCFQVCATASPLK